MITNYARIALRNLIKSKFYTIINILGLSVGYVCAIFILLYVDDELSYDRHLIYAFYKRIIGIGVYAIQYSYIEDW